MLLLLLNSIHIIVTDRRLHSNTLAAIKLALLTTLSSGLRYKSAAEHHTAENSPRPAGQASNRSLKERSIMKYCLPGLSHGTKSLSCSCGNRAKILLKGQLKLASKVEPNMIRSSDSFRIVPTRGNGNYLYFISKNTK